MRGGHYFRAHKLLREIANSRRTLSTVSLLLCPLLSFSSPSPRLLLFPSSPFRLTYICYSYNTIAIHSFCSPYLRSTDMLLLELHHQVPPTLILLVSTSTSLSSPSPPWDLVSSPFVPLPRSSLPRPSPYHPLPSH